MHTTAPPTNALTLRTAVKTDLALEPLLIGSIGVPTTGIVMGLQSMGSTQTAFALSKDGGIYVTTDGGISWSAVSATSAIADPGNAAAIPVTQSGVCAMESAGAETRTLAIPGWLGQRLTLVCDTYGGDIAVTVATAFNVANNTVLTFGAVSEVCELVGVSVGGALVWQIGINDGVALS